MLSEGFEDCLSTSSTFYAEILKITDNLVLAEGCDINGINKQGVYEFIISDNIIIKYNTTKLNTEFALSKLCTGDSVSITYSGGILEKDPAWLENVLVVEVLSNNFLTENKGKIIYPRWFHTSLYFNTLVL